MAKILAKKGAKEKKYKMETKSAQNSSSCKELRLSRHGDNFCLAEWMGGWQGTQDSGRRTGLKATPTLSQI